MAREKITHLFNKNHIEIIRIEHPELTSMTPKYPKGQLRPPKGGCLSKG